LLIYTLDKDFKNVPLKKISIYFNRFIESEVSASLSLLVGCILAILLSNSPFSLDYYNLVHYPIGLTSHYFTLKKTLVLWVNEGLMTIFFLMIGIDIKYEFIYGTLNTRKKKLLPLIGATGGMLIPALIYIAFNKNSVASIQGWAIPTATDIAFSIAALSIFSKWINPDLKKLLITIAIFDDLGAIIVIALFYTKEILWLQLVFSLPLICLLFFLHKQKIQSISIYFLISIIIWLLVIKSGIHATLVGIILALALPITANQNTKSPLNNNLSPAIKVRNAIEPFVNYIILPIFAFINSGINLQETHLNAIISPVSLGIIVGLFIGKQLGIFSFCWLSKVFNISHLPAGINFKDIYGLSIFCGIGFTMSLFIGSLAFETHTINNVYSINYELQQKVGVLVGSFMSAIFGCLYFLILIICNKKRSRIYSPK
jgi:Na+:H+ antiporter, NhaA family